MQISITLIQNHTKTKKWKQDINEKADQCLIKLGLSLDLMYDSSSLETMFHLLNAYTVIPIFKHGFYYQVLLCY